LRGSIIQKTKNYILWGNKKMSKTKKLFDELKINDGIRLSKKELDLAEKYLCFYSLQSSTDENVDETEEHKVKCQILTYDKLHQNKDESAVVYLINKTDMEIDRQYERKNQFENRTGFIMAIWGILLGIIVDNGDALFSINPSLSASYIIMCFVNILILFFGGIYLYYIFGTLKPVKMNAFSVCERDYNYGSAVEDKFVFYVSMLEIISNCFEMNERIITEKSVKYLKAMRYTVVWMLLIAISLLMSEVLY